MPDSFRIVLIDDNPDDRALAIRELRREFPHLKAEEIADQKGFSRILERATASIDLVITDFQLCWSNGLAVLRAVKARWPECPVVMFTGTGSEEIAVEAMKAGLDDYVLKSPKHYARLPAVIRLALRVAQQRQQLRQAEARYGLLFSMVPVGLYQARPNGELLEANPALVEMLRYPDQATLLRVNLADLYLEPADYQDWRQTMERDGVVRNHEARLRTFPGTTCWVQNSARAGHQSSGHGLIYEGSLLGITESKEAEDEREKLIAELQDALTKVKTLSGLLPICAGCKRIRDDKGYWNQIELFIQSHSDAEFTHSFCPDCMKNLYPEVFEDATKLKLERGGN
jgi:PAS domain S-box-containing protein